MKIYNKRESQQHRLKLARELRDTVFIHPTDTVYGIGCNATDHELVQQLRDAKRQHERPLSIIAPGKDWIRTHCTIPEQAEEWLEKLPGPYTYILPKNDKGNDVIADNVTFGKNTLGVRRPNHWFTEVVETLQTPIITTSANVSGNDYMERLDELDEPLKEAVDIAVHEGPIKGTPSKIIDFTAEEPTIIRD